ncbi:heparinase II/III family protein [Cytophaga sp. FL35]|uniref:heparinase II/III domain-containing protein n=1 Tax=Cytophaga sp. FL35 TaxID=1904456 RepID=UPI0016535574|nr:heparinase II/III family protein [Cytophaga sp. FL35]MBC6998303.1 heparinase II/III family protein [Cytophaga sp. FL35]
MTKFLSLLLCLLTFNSLAQPQEIKESKLKNPISNAYLQKKLATKGPRLVLNPEIEKRLKRKLQNDPVVANLYEAIKLNALSIYETPTLVREMEGRRLLHVSREMLYRINMLAMVYRMENDERALLRINEELLAVCGFSDWNPSHFLDVAEMSLAVALAVDWAGEALPKTTLELAKKALIEKGLEPSFAGKHWWIGGENNWNQVCHGGMVAAAIATAKDNPELATKTLKRALDSIPEALHSYGPDGVYPEGSTYWSYGTSFTVTTAAMLESAFHTDFGISQYKPLMKSAIYRTMCNAPSGMYYNFADCGDERSKKGDITLAWFAQKMENVSFFEKERFLLPAKEMGKLDRLAGVALVWISQFKNKNNQEPPLTFKGDGENPIFIVKTQNSDPNQFYLGAKAGKGSTSHGNMDAGSFIFELDGVRWSIDPGNQNYHELEKIGFKLWDKCQECERWTLLTKNNFGHSTLTINNQLHQVDGKSVIIDFQSGNNPKVTIDLTPAFGNLVYEAHRKFTKETDTSLLIEDIIITNARTELVTWQMMTTADVIFTDSGLILHQHGKSLKVENLNHPEIKFSVINLDPPPLTVDRKIEGLKRLELRIPAYMADGNQLNIKVRLRKEQF